MGLKLSLHFPILWNSYSQRNAFEVGLFLQYCYGLKIRFCIPKFPTSNFLQMSF